MVPIDNPRLVSYSTSFDAIVVYANYFRETILQKSNSIDTSVYYVLQSQKVATGYANNKIDKEAVKIDT